MGYAVDPGRQGGLQKAPRAFSGYESNRVVLSRRLFPEAAYIGVREPTRNAPIATEVAQLATLAGGQEMEEEAKATLLSQLLGRRLGLQAKEPFDTLTAHHPKGKPVWDLDD